MKASDLWRRPALALATGLGAGYSPFAPGTVGTLWGLPLVWAVWHVAPGPAAQALWAAALAVLAVPLCEVAERHFRTKDDRRVVADEYLTFPLCLVGLPLAWPMVLVAFLSHRFFDILKPPPARGLQVLRGGLGIAIDDVFASLYSLAANHAVYWLVLRHLI